MTFEEFDKQYMSANLQRRRLIFGRLIGDTALRALEINAEAEAEDAVRAAEGDDETGQDETGPEAD